MFLQRWKAKIRQKEKSSQPEIEPPGHESDTLTTEPPGLGWAFLEKGWTYLFYFDSETSSYNL